MGSTGITAEQVLGISAVVALVAQTLKGAGLTGRWALLAAAVLSAVAVILFGWSNVGFDQRFVWSYFAAWASVFTSAAGIFGIVHAGPEQAMALKRLARREDT